MQKAPAFAEASLYLSGRQDSNLRPPGPKPGAITGLRYAPNRFSAGCKYTGISLIFYNAKQETSTFLWDYSPHSSKLSSMILIKKSRHIVGTLLVCGEGGIRTLGTGLSPYNGLANRPFRPLRHLSSLFLLGCKNTNQPFISQIKITLQPIAPYVAIQAHSL